MRMQCATIIFCSNVKRTLDDPDDVGVEVEVPAVVGVPEDVGDTEAAVVVLEEMTLVRSRTNVPASRCCSSVASTAGPLGGTIPKAQITFCWVSEFALWRASVHGIYQEAY